MSVLHMRAVSAAEETAHVSQIELLETALARLKAGERFTAVAVILADSKGWEYPYSGKHFEIMVGATRLVHCMNNKLDRDTSER